ncbi:Glycosyltransferase, GT2 family [Microlunatus soli]|uniref:Glycosyltransferase, GT2 family n=2 Tax=Microlunatus soli TaxID=630515 RepID=A0A1H1VZK8_9ACTN|nr:Glycosyltransferase, GT2 family [Microlunatus soli]
MVNSMNTAPRVSIVVLSMGDRPEELDRCLRSALAQKYDSFEVFCVGMGWQPEGLPEGVRVEGVEENLGSPGGRNYAASRVRSEVFMFLDDDAWLPDADFLGKAMVIFERWPKLGLLAPRLSDANGTTLRRWVPRAHVGDPNESGPAFTCPEGVTLYRRTAWESVGGFPGNFFHGHEGVDVCWRMRDRGWDAWYEASLTVHHPALPPGRHAYYLRLNARNRVWVARRNLPVPLIPVYVGIWTAISLARNARDWESVKSWVSGWQEGWRTSPGDRDPMHWRTVAKLARLGQPPII